MANGIEFCEGCPKAKRFIKNETEPAIIEIKFSGLARALMQAAKIKHNLISISDEKNEVSETFIVNDSLLDQPGIVKQAISYCTGPENRICPAERYLK